MQEWIRGVNCMNTKVGFTQSARYTCLEDLNNINEFSSANGLNLDYCGCEQCEPSYQFGPFIRKNYVIHVVNDGKGTYKVGDKEYKVMKGQAFLIYPKIETIYKADELEPWYYSWIGFHGYRCEEYLKNMGFTPENPVITLEHPEKLKVFFDKMINTKELTLRDELIRMSSLLEIFAVFLENNKIDKVEKRDYPSSVYVKYAVDYMMSHRKEKIKIDEIAKTIGISRGYLAGSFKKELGISPQEYLINFRLEYAASLIRKTLNPIGDIAAEVGYNDSMAFSKAFKQKFKMSPTAFREAKVEMINYNEKGGYDINKNL
jgi:AraC-like DNA-binding protein